MELKHFYDKALAQGSYAVESNGKVALIDPARDPSPYIKWAEEKNAEIVAVFETHPHADFISSHLEFIKRFNASVYINEKVGVSYAYENMEHGDEVKVGDLRFKALFTPGHSPDHNSYLLIDQEGEKQAVFTGDSLFVGDIGRPDLREGTGNMQVSRKELAGMMYDTLHNVFAQLPDNVKVYPAHGPGSLCGKNMSADLSSTIGNEKRTNWAFSIQSKDKFIEAFLEGQAFIPKYFPNSVEVNRRGAANFDEAISNVKMEDGLTIDSSEIIIDVRDKDKFKQGHVRGAINIQNHEPDKFETWLGAIVDPKEHFYLVADTRDELKFAIERAAKIGYEGNIVSAVTNPAGEEVVDPKIPLADFKDNPKKFTIVDIRNASETSAGKFFESAQTVPLHSLREDVNIIPEDKPIVVHCAGGYRSAAGFSIVKRLMPQAQVYDLSDAVKDFQ